MVDHRIHNGTEFGTASSKPKHGIDPVGGRRVCSNASLYYRWLMQNCLGSKQLKQESDSKTDFKRLCNEYACATELQGIVKKTTLTLPTDSGDVSICMSAIRDVIETLFEGRCMNDSED